MIVQLTCSAHHQITAPPGTFNACPMFVRGHACPGTLTASGPGAREENARLSLANATTTKEMNR